MTPKTARQALQWAKREMTKPGSVPGTAVNLMIKELHRLYAAEEAAKKDKQLLGAIQAHVMKHGTLTVIDITQLKKRFYTN